jgi:pyrroloquinoline quinone biosynthesis protein B
MHRQELSDTVAWRLSGSGNTGGGSTGKSLLFLPDIDSWAQWEERGTSLKDAVSQVDVALLDACFWGPVSET